MSERALSDSLRTSARWACCIAGLISVVSAFFVLFQPPSRSTVEWKEKGVFAKSSATSVDTSTPFTVLVVSGFALLIYGLNGYRIIRLSAAGITAEAASAAAKAEEFYGSTQQDVETLRIEQPGEVAPPPPPSHLQQPSMMQGTTSRYTSSRMFLFPFYVTPCPVGPA